MKALDWIAFALLSIAFTALLVVSYAIGEAHGRFAQRVEFLQTPQETDLSNVCEAYYLRHRKEEEKK